MAYESRHSQLQPDEDSLAFISNAALLPTIDGVRVALDTRFDEGTVYVAASRIVAEQGKRMIAPDTALMCADVEEAKDVVDAILDRLGREARVVEHDFAP